MVILPKNGIMEKNGGLKNLINKKKWHSANFAFCGAKRAYPLSLKTRQTIYAAKYKSNRSLSDT
jgi:hypothetical protein